MEQPKLPPHDIDAEEAVIGSCLINAEAFIQAAPIITTGDFYSERGSWCWEAMRRLADRDEPIDQITVANELDNMGKIENIGGAAYLSHLISIVPTSLDAEHYARIVARCSQARKLIECAGRIASMGYSAGADIDTALRKAQELLLAMTGDTIKPLVYTPRDIAEYGMERYTQLQEKGDETAITYGFHDLDILTGGAHKGDLVLLGGRPRMGKSALAQAWANNMARQHSVLYCSLEMTLSQFIDRDVVAAVRKPIPVIAGGQYDERLFSEILGFLGPMSQRKLYFLKCEGAPVTTSDIRAAVARLKLEAGLDVIFVDYLGLLADGYGHTENERVGYISRSLKGIARQSDVAVIAVSQLSRAVEKERYNKRPRLADLRDSGSLEQDADVVMFLYRDDVYYMEEEWEEEFNKVGNKWKPKGERKAYPRGVAELGVEKQRQRESGVVVKLNWNGKLIQFTDYQPSVEPQLTLVEEGAGE
jgi:replicative DNA helicase